MRTVNTVKLFKVCMSLRVLVHHIKHMYFIILYFSYMNKLVFWSYVFEMSLSCEMKCAGNSKRWLSNATRSIIENTHGLEQCILTDFWPKIFPYSGKSDEIGLIYFNSDSEDSLHGQQRIHGHCSRCTEVHLWIWTYKLNIRTLFQLLFNHMSLHVLQVQRGHLANLNSAVSRAVYDLQSHKTDWSWMHWQMAIISIEIQESKSADIETMIDQFAEKKGRNE